MRWCLVSLVAFALAAPPAGEARRMSFLDDGVVKVGVDLDEGGVITFVSRSGGADADNLVNDHDLGRQVQQSYYAGPEGLGIPCPSFGTVWNPIGAGDCFGHPSTVLASSNDGRTIYVESRPLQWAFDAVPCECTFEHWIELDGRAVIVSNRLTNARTDHTLYPAMDQELPAVYSVGRLPRLLTYAGNRPWTGGPLTRVTATLPNAAPFLASEHWAAHVNASGFGLGVFSPGLTSFIGGFHGTAGVGGPFDDSTGYISPVRPELLDWNIVYEYDFALVLGTVDDIRAYATAHRAPTALDWRFTASREGFSYVNAGDSGVPIRDVLRVTLDRQDPQLVSPPTFWRAEEVGAVDVRMALHGTAAHEGEIFWARAGGDFTGSQRVAFPVVADGSFHAYRVPLAGAVGYSGAITRLRLDPIVSGEAPGAYAEVDAITAVGRQPTTHPRALTLSLQGSVARGRLSVRDGYAACADHAHVVLERRANGWHRVASTTTTTLGAYRFRIRGHGVFRVRAARTLRDGDTCAATVSRLRRG